MKLACVEIWNQEDPLNVWLCAILKAYEDLLKGNKYVSYGVGAGGRVAGGGDWKALASKSSVGKA